MRYVTIDKNYILITQNKNDYTVGGRINNKEGSKSKKFLNLNCFKLKGEKRCFKKGVSIELLLIDCKKDSEEADNNNNIMIMKIGSKEVYFHNHNLVINDNKEILIEKEEGEERQLSHYKIHFKKDINGSIEISNENNKRLNGDNVLLYELKIYENNRMINDYIFNLPFIGKDLISSNDFNLEIIDEIKTIEREIQTEMLLKENGNIFIYDDKYFINKQEMDMNKDSRMIINVELSNSLFEIVLSVYIYI